MQLLATYSQLDSRIILVMVATVLAAGLLALVGTDGNGCPGTKGKSGDGASAAGRETIRCTILWRG